MDINNRIIKARIQLVLDNPFFGTIVLQTKLKQTEKIETFAVDGEHLLYNKSFAETLSDTDLQFILAHEVMHLILTHLTRRNEREIIKWNYAVDYAVNIILDKEFIIPKGALFNNKYKNMTAEQIYNILPENPEPKTKQGKEYKNFDEHKDINKEIENKIKIQVSKAYNIAKNQGKLSANIDIFINEILNPKLNWKSLLRQYVNNLAKNDYNWRKPNKRFIHKNIYMPSLMSESLGDVVVIIDNSGSTQEYQQRFISECNGILQQYDVTLHLITVDTKVNSYNKYTKGDKIKKQYAGCGGTDIRAGFNHIKKKRITPNVIVCLTDGYTEMPRKINTPTIWVLTEDRELPFGQKVLI